MTYTVWQSKGIFFDLETDYVVVGSGVGGASAVVILVWGGETVVIVEVGSWWAPQDYFFFMYGVM